MLLNVISPYLKKIRFITNTILQKKMENVQTLCPFSINFFYGFLKNDY